MSGSSGAQPGAAGGGKPASRPDMSKLVMIDFGDGASPPAAAPPEPAPTLIQKEVRPPAPAKRSLARAAVLIAFAAVMLLAAAAILGRKPAPARKPPLPATKGPEARWTERPKLPKIDLEEGKVTKDKTITVKGHAPEGTTEVDVNKERAKLKDGDFEATVPAASEVEVVARGKDGEVIARETRHLIIDRDDPVITIDGGLEKHTRGTSITVAGTVRDANLPSSIEVDGVQVPLLEGGRFGIDVPLAPGEEKTVTILARDLAGNEASRAVVVKRD